MKHAAWFVLVIVVSGTAWGQNFNNAIPPPPAGGTNILWQSDTATPNRVSGYIPAGTYAFIYGTITPGHCASWFSATQIQDAGVCNPGGGVTAINSITGAFTFNGAGVSCTGGTTPTCTFSGGGSTGFGALTGGVNTTANMVVGSGAVLTQSGSGVVNANQVNGQAIPVSASALASDASGHIVAGSGGGSPTKYNLLNALCQGSGTSTSGSMPMSALSTNGGYCQAGSSTTFQSGAYVWSLTSLAVLPTQWADQQFVLPATLTGTYSLVIKADFDTATSQTLNFSFQYACVADGSSFAAAPSAVQTFAMTAASSTGNAATVTGTPTITGCSGANLMYTRVGVVSGGTAVTGSVRPRIAVLSVQ